MPVKKQGNQEQPVKYVASIEHVVNGTAVRLGNLGHPFDFNIGKWHNIKITTVRNKISCSIDEVNFGEIEYKSLQKQHVVAGYDKTNGEIIVKVVNGEKTPLSTTINLIHTTNVNPVGQIITLTSASNKDDNSFAEPKKVSPVINEYKGFSNSFKMEFKPNSFTILRIKATRE